MPIDVKAVLEAATSFGQERDEPVRVDLAVDATAARELAECVEDAFAPAAAQLGVEFAADAGARPAAGAGADVRRHTFGGGRGLPALRADADLCIVVGGQSKALGNVLGSARNNGTLAVCVVERDVTFFEDPAAGEGGVSSAGIGADGADDAGEDADIVDMDAPKALQALSAGQAEDEDDVEYVMGIDVDDIVDVSLAEARPLEPLAKWVATRLPKKRLALAAAFPFMRRAISAELSQNNAIANAAIGIVAFVPGSDMPLITLNQAKLVLQMAAVYGQDLDKRRAKEIVAVVAGAFGWRALARRLSRFVPVLGIPVKTAVAYTGTLAVGHAACAYFENGGEEKYEHAVNEAVRRGRAFVSQLSAKGK